MGQVLRSLMGITPIRSFANIGDGFANMVLEPLKQYRTGGDTQRISWTILRGLVSFLRHVTVESIDLTECIFVGTQSALEYVNAFLCERGEVVTGAGGALGARGPPDSVDSSDDAIGLNWTPVERGVADFLQPGDTAEGLQQA